MLLLNNKALSRQQIPCVKRVNKSWNKKTAKTSPPITTEREANDTASVCQQFQLKLSSVIWILKGQKQSSWGFFLVSVHDLLILFHFFLFISPSYPTHLPERMQANIWLCLGLVCLWRVMASRWDAGLTWDWTSQISSGPGWLDETAVQGPSA